MLTLEPSQTTAAARFAAAVECGDYGAATHLIGLGGIDATAVADARARNPQFSAWLTRHEILRQRAHMPPLGMASR